MAFLRRKREDPKVDLTPMVDVVFLLLIFFMISTTFVETPGITIKLPESSSRMEERAPKEVKVYLSKEGKIYLENKLLTRAQLDERLRGYGARAGEMTFLLLADKDSRHGRVVQLMDAARQAGFGKLAIATESDRKGP